MIFPVPTKIFLLIQLFYGALGVNEFKKVFLLFKKIISLYVREVTLQLGKY